MSELRAGLLRGRITQTLLACLWPASLIALVVLVSFATTVALIGAMPLAVLIGIFLAARHATAARPVVERGVLKTSGDDVLLGSRRIARRSRIISGAVVPSAAEGVVVRLERRGGVPLEFHAGDLERAQDLLVALELDPRRAVAHFHVLATDVAEWRRRMQRIIPGLLLFVATVAVTARSGVPAMVPLLVLLVVAFSLTLIVPARVTVGSDGISIRRFGRERFISLDGVADAVVEDGDAMFNSTLCLLRLVDENGGTVRKLVVDQKKQGPFTESIHQAIDARAEALAVRIREVIQLRRARDDAFDPRALARGERDLAHWIAALRSLSSRTAGFRDEEPPAPESLLAIVEDTSANPLDRAAAAVALSRADDAYMQRVRVVAAATAAPRLRVALEASLDDDEQKLTSALEELERTREA